MGECDTIGAAGRTVRLGPCSAMAGGVVFAALAVAPAAHAQEAMYTQAATMPSPHTGVLRFQMHAQRYGADAAAGLESTEQVELMTDVQYGLARSLSLTIAAPVVLRRDNFAAGGDDETRGVEDIDAMLKWRVYKSDTGGVDTLRVALLGGASFASGDSADFSSQTVNPHIGAVVTLVRGRHGFNQDAIFRLNTGGDDDHNFGGDSSDDAFFHNTAYVFRLAPDRFTSQSAGAWYTTTEVSGIYETNGDYELRGSAGLMYEGRRFAAEAMVQFPLVDEARHRAELDLAIGFGVRFSF